MLALFAATAFAFVVIASHANRSAKSLQNAGREVFSPRLDLDEAMRQALRDTAVPTSVVRGHSLMSDLYGENAVTGWVINGFTVSPDFPFGTGTNPNPKGLAPNLLPGIPTAVTAHQTAAAGGQVIEFTAGYTLPGNNLGYSGGLIPDFPEGNPSAGQLATAGNQVPTTRTIPEWFGASGTNAVANEPSEFQRRVGCVLTIVDPNSRRYNLYNKSTRIVGYRRVPFSDASGTVIYHRYQVLPFEGVSAADTVNYFRKTGDPSRIKNTGPDFVINGTPFSGTGVGYNPNPIPGYAVSDAKIFNNAGYTGSPFEQPFALLPNPTDPNYYAPTALYTPYSPNEDYDAPDAQNMLLAMEHFDGAGTVVTRSPSLHRPALADYWLHRLAALLQGSSYGLLPVEAWRVLIRPELAPTAAVKNTILEVKRRCLLRPLSEDHPDFDGSNSNWPTANTPKYDTASVLADSDISRLQAKARRAWGAANLVPGLTYPWFVDVNNDGLPDDTNGDGLYNEEIVPWDVDNDGDGVPDSIWVDIGLPVRSLPDGRKYKPLVAMHCIDLDGRLNLNTAGSLEQLANKYTHDATGLLYPGNPVNSDELRDDYFAVDGVVYGQQLTESVGPAADATSNVSLRRGQGTGPAEISLYPMFYEIAKSVYTVPADRHNYAMLLYRNLMLGWKGTLSSRYVEFDGRYGELYERTAAEFYKPGPGKSNTAEALAMARLFGMPTAYNYMTWLASGTPSPWGSPLDLKGAMTVGLDLFGQPIYSDLRPVALAVNPLGYVYGSNQLAFASSLVDTPYELRLGRLAAQDAGSNAGQDNPFTIAEFEPFLRRFDADAYRLPGRLRQLLNAGANDPYRFMATTESWDIPVPAMALPKELLDDWQVLGQDPVDANKIRPPLHIDDLIAARIHSVNQAWVSDPSCPPPALSLRYPSAVTGVANAVEGAKRVNIAELLGTDLLSGLRMDLNRPFGNGVDDDGDGIVDEPSERLTLAAAGRFEMFSATARFDHDNDGWEYRDYDGSGTIDAAEDNPSLPGALAEHLEASPVHDRIYEYRQAYARHLYVLMMALVDEAWYPEWDPFIARQLNTNTSFVPSAVDRQQARARAIAQWAINVVDFCDSDSIMTPFEYDIYPFATAATSVAAGQLISTWSGDGDPATHEDDTGVVFGCERPELLITETVATHDRRQSQKPPTSSPPPDPREYINTRRPEGALFVEVFNPNTPSELVAGEFAVDPSSGNNVGGIRLNQQTPGSGSPVWRLAIYALPTDRRAGELPNNRLGYADPLDATLSNPPTLARLVYFVDSSDVLPDESPTVPAFRPSASALAPILPRRYAVVGPGDYRNNQYGPGPGNGVTLLGATPASDVSNLRRIEIVPNVDPNVTQQVRVFADGVNDSVEQLRSAGAVSPPVGIVIDKVRAGASTSLRDLRLSISEPINGYAADATPPPANFNWVNGYDDGATPQDPAEDLSRSDTWGATDSDNDNIYEAWNGPLGGNGGTVSAVHYVHLQRLADPTRPYHVDQNPYRTVDFAPVDLTVFDSDSGADNHVIPSDNNRPYPLDSSNVASLFTRQRGEEIGDAANTRSFWQPVLVNAPDTNVPLARNPVALNGSVAATHTHFNGSLGASLGYLNEFYFEGRPLSASDFAVSASYAGAPGTESGAAGSLRFNPDPFPWITWLNRPFANPLELLQVPVVGSSQLLASYENDLTKAPTANQSYTGGHEGFSHLGSFFAARNPSDNSPSADVEAARGRLRGLTDATLNDLPAAQVRASNFYRILEYVHVPTRFVNSYVHGYDAALMGQRPNEPPHLFHPPFNTFSDYREPGKINLNTLNEQTVWQGLAGDDAELADPNTAAFFINARRAYGDPATGPFDLDPLASAATPPLPTRVANPFRSFAGEYLLPSMPGRDIPDNPMTLPGMPVDPANNEYDPYFAHVIQEGVNATLLRARFNPGNLLEPLNNRPPLFANSASTAAYDNDQKNPYYQYESLSRLSNLTTTRSNVYALWITVGYFEVEKYGLYDPGVSWHKHVYPEGYTIGQELGVESGEVKRHRAFYVIDRSIPVGFVPGQDLNTEKAVLLRRFIE